MNSVERPLRAAYMLVLNNCKGMIMPVHLVDHWILVREILDESCKQ